MINLGKNIFSRKKTTITFRILFYVEQVVIDNADLTMEESNISFTTIGSNALSSCHFFLIVGTINHKKFCYLSHSSRLYDETNDQQKTAANIIRDTKWNIQPLHIHRPKEHPRPINFLNMKNLKLLVGGGGIDDGSQNLIQQSLESINDQKP